MIECDDDSRIRVVELVWEKRGRVVFGGGGGLEEEDMQRTW